MRRAPLTISLALTTVALGVTWGGCRQNAPQRSPEERIDAAVAEKLAAWRARRALECRRAALEEAQRLADTLIMDYALAKKLELPRPSRPIRPEEPPLLRPSDTLRMAPYREDTLIRAAELPRRRVAAPVGAASAVRPDGDSLGAPAYGLGAPEDSLGVPVDSLGVPVDSAGTQLRRGGQ